MHAWFLLCFLLCELLHIELFYINTYARIYNHTLASASMRPTPSRASWAIMIHGGLEARFWLLQCCNLLQHQLGHWSLLTAHWVTSDDDPERMIFSLELRHSEVATGMVRGRVTGRRWLVAAGWSSRWRIASSDVICRRGFRRLGLVLYLYRIYKIGPP